MANTWTITKLDCFTNSDGKKDVVLDISWRRNAGDLSDNGVERVTLDPASPFTPYASLTEPQVIDWLESALGPARIAEIDETLALQAAALINPPVVTLPLPWEK